MTAFEPVHAPDRHVPVCLQALASLLAAPLALAGFEQRPVAASHVPATWHWSDAKQTTGFEPVHAPDWHVSVCVQALPSLHAVPLALAGFEQTPVAVSHVPAT